MLRFTRTIPAIPALASELAFFGTILAINITAGSAHTGATATPARTPTIAVSVQSLNPRGSTALDQCLTIAAGDAAAYECGALRVVHALPVTRTMNRDRAPTLIYNSDRK